MWQNYQISEQFPSQKEEAEMDLMLFTKKEYWLFHLRKEEILPVLVKDDNGNILSYWCFYKSSNEIRTPFSAPYFKPFISRTSSFLIQFEVVKGYLKSNYNQKVYFAFLKSLMDEYEFFKSNIQSVDIGTVLSVDKADFSRAIVNDRKSRKLNSLLKDRSFKTELVRKNDWKETYELNLSWRIEKGHQNFISSELMRNLKLKFPQNYQAFHLINSDKVVGTVFFVKIHSEFLYVYSLITNPKYDAKEPSLLLWNAVYNWAFENKILFIDMGTSMLSNKSINKELLSYKLKIGGKCYRKYNVEC
ncbi:hypothetical protein QYS48_16130 [Marivirga arenosa]|uniref:Uncharacterized protein n=1 Tax=Marivirga arenosa TaxID=3059076 RepID=A0AA49JAR2_9BACT|nr:hypothetical protein [Marivirga sp. ABR2-2]WKK83790.2 hypothetical protein QYS48_16130 [Marivirga sp. ABR2-2]